jgi:hypothetical protein
MGVDAAVDACALAPDVAVAAAATAVEVGDDTPDSACDDPDTAAVAAAVVAGGDGLRVWRIRRLRVWS